MWRTIISFIVIFSAVVSISAVSSRFWAGEQEQQAEKMIVTVSEGMTVAEFGTKHDLDRNAIKRIFNLASPHELDKRVADFGMNQEVLGKKVNGILALQAEHASKNWFKILAKGSLWAIFLLAVFVLLKRGKVTAQDRKWIYMAAVGLFGVFLGSDPSPMGTVKDAIVLLASKGVVFPPRLIALTIFLLMSILANKFICSWGCQVGTLQDLIFRLNRDSKDRKGLLGQVKIPFRISNSVRVFFFVLLVLAAFVWAMDIVETIDPFKIFKPRAVSMVGGFFVVSIMVLSLFTYRPWCHFFCPFGLVGWLAEKISIFRMKVDYDKCVSCEACSKACPSTVMDAILKRNRVIPDCFSCGTCMETCPAHAISFARGPRPKPPEGKFDEQ